MNEFYENIELVIINYNGKEITSDCVNSLLELKFPEKNIIIVDNASTDGSVEFLKQKFDELNFVKNQNNLGYAGAVNAGMKKVTKEFAVISNNDVIFKDNSIDILIRTLINNKKIGAAGPQQIFPDGSWQRSSGFFPSPNNFWKEIFLFPAIYDKIQKMKFKNNSQKLFFPQYIDGAVIATKKTIFDEINGFDEYFFFYSEEVNFCYQLLNNGYKAAINPDAKVVHLRGASSKEINVSKKSIKMLVEGKFKFLKKHFKNSEINEFIIATIINHRIYYIIWFILGLTGLKKQLVSEKKQYFRTAIKDWKIKSALIK